MPLAMSSSLSPAVTTPLRHPFRWAGRLPLFILCALFASVTRAEEPGMLGFTALSATNQLAWEKKFDSALHPADQRAWLERMASEPNHAGSPHDKANAEFILEKFRQWGWEARIEQFDVLYPTPKAISLEMVAPSSFKARLHEPQVEPDRTSGKTEGALPPYHAYGADGDVTADLVYVNQGMPSDYKDLARHGITVKGRIVIARYGGGWRGLKPKLAAEQGAVGCIVYSDPHEDGYWPGDVYPKGAFRPGDGVQRGSVLDLPVRPGDPLTPGQGATSDARRLPLAEAGTIAKIPVIPISYRDAQPLLSALEGPVAAAEWRGSLPITYHLGPGPARVHLKVLSEWRLTPIYNVIAVIKGTEYPDQWVLRGNHHDGWVFGAWDPLSANVAMLAEAQAIAALLKDGWKPKRTLVYCSWDAEEPGLLGSTEWVEAHRDELRQKALLYLNSDNNGRGFLRAGGSHSLQTLVHQVATEVRDPQMGTNALQRLRARILVDAYHNQADPDDKIAAKAVGAGRPPPLEALGSGSDYSPFLQHAGIASLDIRYGGEDKGIGIYHSVYDSFDHYLRFGDPDLAYGVALAQTIGRVILRVANADLLPMRAGDFADTLQQYLLELQKLTGTLRERTRQQERLLDENLFHLAHDPTEAFVPPPREKAVPFLNFAPLENAVSRLQASARNCDDACQSALSAGLKDPARAAAANRLWQGLEQTLIHPSGLPRRPWYRHMIYAPGLHTGYGVKTLPGIREAIEERRWGEADEYMTIVAEVLTAYSARLDQIAAVLRP